MVRPPTVEADGVQYSTVVAGGSAWCASHHCRLIGEITVMAHSVQRGGSDYSGRALCGLHTAPVTSISIPVRNVCNRTLSPNIYSNQFKGEFNTRLM